MEHTINNKSVDSNKNNNKSINNNNSNNNIGNNNCQRGDHEASVSSVSSTVNEGKVRSPNVSEKEQIDDKTQSTAILSSQTTNDEQNNNTHPSLPSNLLPRNIVDDDDNGIILTDNIPTSQRENRALRALDTNASASTQPQILTTKDIQQKLKYLLQQIESDILRYANDKEILCTLTQVKDYIDTHLNNNLQLITTDADKVRTFENKMFALLDEISRYDNASSQKRTLPQIKQEIISLIKEIAVYKQSLLKKTNKDNETEMKSFINRLEDLQENLADLEYTLRSKHHTAPSTQETVHRSVDDESVPFYNEL